MKFEQGQMVRLKPSILESLLLEDINKVQEIDMVIQIIFMFWKALQCITYNSIGKEYEVTALSSSSACWVSGQLGTRTNMKEWESVESENY